MNRSVLLTNGNLSSVQRAAAWFAAAGDHVYISRTENAEALPEGVCSLPFDPMCRESLTAAVSLLEMREGKLDILILSTGSYMHDGEIGTGHDCDAMLDILMQNLYGSFETIEAFLPLLRRGMKRIAAITDMESSNSYSAGKDDLAYSASKAALNMMGKIYFNKLRPEGFTFRWYCETDETGEMSAGEYIASALCYDEKEPYIHSDENRLVLRDGFLREISW